MGRELEGVRAELAVAVEQHAAASADAAAEVPGAAEVHAVEAACSAQEAFNLSPAAPARLLRQTRPPRQLGLLPHPGSLLPPFLAAAPQGAVALAAEVERLEAEVARLRLLLSAISRA